jgi:hypothetical protein
MGVGWKYSIKSFADAGVEAPSKSPSVDTRPSVTATVRLIWTPCVLNRGASSRDSGSKISTGLAFRKRTGARLGLLSAAVRLHLADIAGCVD